MEEGLTATPILCGAVLGACAAGHDWALALRILGNMQHYCVAPDPLALSSTSMSLEMAGQFELRQQFTIVLHSHIAAWLCGIHPQISSAPTFLLFGAPLEIYLFVAKMRMRLAGWHCKDLSAWDDPSQPRPYSVWKWFQIDSV